MRWFPKNWLKKVRELMESAAPPPSQQVARILAMERDIILPVKAVFVGILLQSLFFSSWFEDTAMPWDIAQQIIERFFLIYLFLNAVAAALLLLPRPLPLPVIQWIAFSVSVVDALFLAALTLVTGGFDSILYWAFLGLIVRNAISFPRVRPQLVLNFSTSLCYLLAGILDATINQAGLAEFDENTRRMLDSGIPDHPTEPFLLRLVLLWLMAACCYGVQVLFEKQRQADEEAREFAARQEKLQSAGRLAAQIAHQIKNPLGIINNAAFSLRRALLDGKNPNLQQLEIIREEVERSDRIITKLMGYAQLAEGKVEKLNPVEEIDRAVVEVFPPAANYGVEIVKDYSLYLPTLLMQRNHLSEILVNILQNARDVLQGGGRIEILARHGENNSVVVTIRDNGPGIPPEMLKKIFTPYFSTRKQGSGLGLAIVKHNTEIYGGTVAVQSELGKGTQFTLNFPTRTIMRFQR